MRIAIVRLTSLGDVVHTLPVAAAIRRHRPDDEIVWIVEEHEQALLTANPCIDRVVVAPLRRWRRRCATGRLAPAVKELRELAAVLRSMRIDTTIDVQGWWHKTSPLVVLTRAERRIGFSRQFARDPVSPLFTTTHVTPPPGAEHIVEQNLALLTPLGIETATPEFILPAWRDAEPRVHDWMAARGLEPREVIALLPSTRGPKKLWPAGAYAELARRLRSATGMPVVVAGGPRDERVLAGVAGADLYVYAPEPISDLAVFLGRTALVVGNDTGPLHLAAAATVPTLGLFGPTFGARNGPYGPTGHFIQSATSRMSDIPVEQVLAASLRLLQTHAGLPCLD